MGTVFVKLKNKASLVRLVKALMIGIFLAGAVTNAIPGIILQIVLVPVTVMLLDNPKILKLRD
jgi:hypothetical protein